MNGKTFAEEPTLLAQVMMVDGMAQVYPNTLPAVTPTGVNMGDYRKHLGGMLLGVTALKLSVHRGQRDGSFGKVFVTQV